MVQYMKARLDASFAALSDATRRGVLEQAGLVTTAKAGRVRICKLGRSGLEDEAAWIERHRQAWDAHFDEWDKVIQEMKQKEKANGRKKQK